MTPEPVGGQPITTPTCPNAITGHSEGLFLVDQFVDRSAELSSRPSPNGSAISAVCFWRGPLGNRICLHASLENVGEVLQVETGRPAGPSRLPEGLTPLSSIMPTATICQAACPLFVSGRRSAFDFRRAPWLISSSRSVYYPCSTFSTGLPLLWAIRKVRLKTCPFPVSAKRS